MTANVIALFNQRRPTATMTGAWGAKERVAAMASIAHVLGVMLRVAEQRELADFAAFDHGLTIALRLLDVHHAIAREATISDENLLELDAIVAMVATWRGDVHAAIGLQPLGAILQEATAS